MYNALLKSTLLDDEGKDYVLLTTGCQNLVEHKAQRRKSIILNGKRIKHFKYVKVSSLESYSLYSHYFASLL